MGEKRKYKYNTIPKREVFVDRLLSEISAEHKDFVDLLIDCNEWYRNSNNGKNLLNKQQMQLVTVFLHFRYTNLQNYIESEVDEYNNAINKIEGRQVKNALFNYTK